MKKKFSLWINLAVICLCVCSIAIGVYAATSATLTISGQIGFEAHGLSYTASAKAKGYATNPDDASTYKSEYQIFDNLTNNKITLGDMYFTDLVGETVPTIEIQISITNGSLFPVEAMLSLPTTSVLQQNITFDVENGLAQMGDTNDAETKTQTITIKMTLKNAETTELEELQGLDFTISLNKLAKIKGDATNGYYMTMGSNVVTTNNIQQVEAVKWIPFAESSDGQNWSSFVNTNKPDSSKQYYFIAEKILDLGHTFNSYDAGVCFNANYSAPTQKDTRVGYENIKPNTYLTSNVRDLLNNKTVPKGYVNNADIYSPDNNMVNLFSEYSIGGGALYQQITARPASDLYDGSTSDSEYQNIPEKHKHSDKLWLLSDDELAYMTLESQRIGHLFYLFDGEMDEAMWFLRTPDADSPTYALGVNPGGEISYPDISADWGIRPAFQLDLSSF